MAQVSPKHDPKRPSCAQKPTKPALYFCPQEAEALGLNEAIVIARLRFWLSRSKHVFGGKTLGVQHVPGLAEAVSVVR